MVPPPALPGRTYSPDRESYRDDVEEHPANPHTNTVEPGEELAFDDADQHETNNSYKWIPAPLQRTSKTVVKWVKGPQPPRIWKINPIFPNIQKAPLRLLQRYCPKRKHKVGLLIGFCFIWLLTFVTVLRKSAFASEVAGYGSPVRLSCAARYWGNGNTCGIDGDLCRPFKNNTLAFRCPANCKRVQVLNPHAVGNRIRKSTTGHWLLEDRKTLSHQQKNGRVIRGV
jgi:hypothetical protein